MHKTIAKLLSLHYVLFENTKPFLLFKTARHIAKIFNKILHD